MKKKQLLKKLKHILKNYNVDSVTTEYDVIEMSSEYGYTRHKQGDLFKITIELCRKP